MRRGFGNTLQLWRAFGVVFVVPLLLAYFQGSGLMITLIVGVVVSVFTWLIFSLVPLINGSSRSMPDDPTRVDFVLESITVSHFCEKVRWCLDEMQLKFHEHHNFGILGVLMSARTVPVLHYTRHAPAETVLGDSRMALRFLYGLYPDSEFLRPNKRRLELEEAFHKLGHAVQRWGYSYLLYDPTVKPHLYKRGWGVKNPEIPLWQRAIGAVFGSILSKFIVTVMRLAKPSTKERAFKTICDAFMVVEEHFKANPTDEYLCDNTYTFVDVTFASLSGIIWMVDGYGGGVADSCKWLEDDWTTGMRKDIEHLQEQYPRAIAYVQRVYNDHR